MYSLEVNLVALLPLTEVLGGQQLEQVVPHLIVADYQRIRACTRTSTTNCHKFSLSALHEGVNVQCDPSFNFSSNMLPFKSSPYDRSTLECRADPGHYQILQLLLHCNDAAR